MDISVISDKIFQIGKMGKLPSFVLACICWSFILLPVSLSDLLGISEMINSNRSTIGIWAILLTVYLLSFLAYEYLSGYFTQLIILKRVKKRLRNLTNDEKDALRHYIEENKRTHQFRMSDGIAGGLLAKQIIYRSSNLGSIGDYFPYNIHDYAFEYLKKYKHLLVK